MLVEHVVTKLTGGAGLSVVRIDKAMSKYVESTIVTENSYSGGGSTYFRIIYTLKKIIFKIGKKGIMKLIKKSSPHWEMFDYFSGFVNYRSSADIVHFHWVSDFVKNSSFKNFKDRKVLITLHDMEFFTGGCHYAWSCTKYKDECSSCPQLQESSFDIARINFRKKKRIFNEVKPVVIATSEYMYSAAKSSILLGGCQIEHIALGVDLEKFYPLDQKSCRTSLNISYGEKNIIIGFGADSVLNKRKGAEFLLPVLEGIAKKGYVVNCVVFGGGEINSNIENVKFLNLGKVISEDMLRIIYNSMDFFMGLSLYEAFGQTCLEAMACGTPSVVFEGTGFNDFIKNGLTGIVVEHGDVESIIEQVVTSANDSDRMAQFKKICRDHATDFELDKKVQEILALYQSLD